MRTDLPVVINRLDYAPPPWLVDEIELVFELDPQQTRVSATSTVRRNPAAGAEGAAIALDGSALELESVSINGQRLTETDYTLADDSLTIQPAAVARLAPGRDALRLEIVTRTAPADNSTLTGLYLSSGNYFTQCEATGFRRITFFPDRPDVMARYRVTLRAAREACPVLLSNGNLVSERALDATEAGGREGWHEAVWEDPFRKPSYLFALVAGRLVLGSERRIRTLSGREALLQIWVEPGDQDKTGWAMESLERAIGWDERRFGLELDLERFMIVAVGDFNMGAMENKGLNIFNTRYVFADPRMATDADYANVESVVGHEYFHNWTGNRVTCRDWFQLTLKEGLTVFRDQEFSAELLAEQAGSAEAAASARAVKRIEDVRVLRTAQFPEDAGPMAHPIRPDAYQEINNFYTVTVYEKGAEVIRMLQTLVGRDGFRRGLDLYFERHDGQAVTCDDFVAAIADANGRDLALFSRWYAQAGTPRIEARGHHDPAARTFTLDLLQRTPPTPGQPKKLPLQIPFAVGLVGPDGRDLPLRLEGEPAAATTGEAPETATPAAITRVLELTEPAHRFTFVDLPTGPAPDGAPFAVVPSLLRDFCAPVVVDYPYDHAQLAFLLAHDADPFNRWEASQRLATACVLGVLEPAGAADGAGQAAGVRGAGKAAALDVLAEGWARVLDEARLTPAYKELVLTLPSEGFIAEQIASVDPVAVRAARNRVRGLLGARLAPRWREAVAANETPGPYRPEPEPAGRRALRALALAYLAGAHDGSAADAAGPGPVHEAAAQAQREAFERYTRADNMTDRLGALAALMGTGSPLRDQALALYADSFAREPLAMDKWFTLQATMHRQPGEPPVIERVRALMAHPAFSLRNPNKVRALVGAFCNGNLAEFHAADGSGYAFWAEQVRALDAINPQVASRMARALDRWRKFTPERQHKMREALQAVAGKPGLSPDVREIVEKALA